MIGVDKSAARGDSHSVGDEVIRLAGVAKRYVVGQNVVNALDGVSFGVRPGEFLAIMGSSGSGKSTMLNILGCLDRPTEGEYWLNGVDVARMDDDALSDHRLYNLGFVFQSFHLIPQLTVAENIALPLFYRGVDDEDVAPRVLELATSVGMENRLEHRPAELSGGQRQRVAIARALANNPPVILADEPTGNLDTATSVQIMNLLTELNAQGRTILMVTHEEDVAAFAKSRIVLRDGRIVTGKNSDEMHAAAAMVMNAVKTLSGIPSQIPLIGPNVIQSIAHMKQDILKVGYTSLNLDETLIGLAISSATNPAAQLAMEKLNDLRGCEVHMTHIVTPGDEAGLRRLGCRFTSDPYYATNALFNGEA